MSVLSYGYKNGAYKPRIRPPVCTVYHSTGPGPNRRRLSNPGKFSTNTDAAIWMYANGIVGNSGPHDIICPRTGDVTNVCPYDHVAQHVGTKTHPGWHYKLPAIYKIPQWWRERWPVKTPLHLHGGRIWKGMSANANTVGREVVQEMDDDGNPLAWSEKALKTIAELHAEDMRKYGREYCLMGHADVHPRARTNKFGKRYDPLEVEWDSQAFSLRLIQGLVIR